MAAVFAVASFLRRLLGPAPAAGAGLAGRREPPWGSRASRRRRAACPAGRAACTSASRASIASEEQGTRVAISAARADADAAPRGRRQRLAPPPRLAGDRGRRRGLRPRRLGRRSAAPGARHPRRGHAPGAARALRGSARASETRPLLRDRPAGAGCAVDRAARDAGAEAGPGRPLGLHALEWRRRPLRRRPARGARRWRSGSRPRGMRPAGSPTT